MFFRKRRKRLLGGRDGEYEAIRSLHHRHLDDLARKLDVRAYEVDVPWQVFLIALAEVTEDSFKLVLPSGRRHLQGDKYSFWLHAEYYTTPFAESV